MKGLDRLLDICEGYGKDNIKYNPKSTTMIIRSKWYKNVHFPGFKLNGEDLKEVTQTKYLGHILTNDLTDDKDVLRQCRQVYFQSNVLVRKFHMCTPGVKLTLFMTYCSPLYTSRLWWNYKLSSIRKLYVAYNNGLRILLNIPRYHNGVNYSASQMFV